MEGLLRDGGTRVSTVSLAEVLDVLNAGRGSPGTRSSASSPASCGRRSSPFPTSKRPTERPTFGDADFDRRTCRVSLADCFVVATAQPGGRLATADRILIEVARAEGLDVVDFEAAPD